MRVKLGALVRKLETKIPTGLSTTIGFDGFVDEIIEVVDKRHSFDSYTRMTSMAQFGERVKKAAGLSTNIEFVPKTVKLGGNGPIMANALVQLGAEVSYIGALGVPNLHPVFSELAGECQEVFSIAQPGHTDAVEFNDGKIMLGKMETLNDVNWATLVAKVGEEKLRELFSRSDLVATVNWTMMAYMNEIWSNLLALLKPCTSEAKPFLLVDLADPGKRSTEDLKEAIAIIQNFSKCYRVIVGLNRKEATEIANVINLELKGPADSVELEEIVTALGKKLDVWCVLVHPTFAAGAYVEGEYWHTEGPYTSEPRLTTGAGDNFNAGFCLGLMLKLTVEESLILGKATSGFYVRQMYSPSWPELLDFLHTWSTRAGEDF